MKRRNVFAIAVESRAGLAYHGCMVAATDRSHVYCADRLHVEKALSEYVQRHRLLQEVSRVGLAVSGGADSVALFHLMRPLCREAGVAVTVLHLNHGLRPEAEEEERFVRALAAEAGLPFLSRRAALAARPPDGSSLEMAARAARLAFFRQCREEAGLDAVATGHQADDVAETLLLRLARGAGAAGLSGLRPLARSNAGLLIRPLLAISGQALRAWLLERGLAWREDASNSDTSIPRNFVRNALLPQLERTWAPDLRARLCQSAETLREDDHLLEALAEQQLAALAAGAPLPVRPLLLNPVALQRRILRQWLFRQAQPAAAGLGSVRALLERCREPGDWQLALPGNVFAACRNGALAVRTPPGGTAAPAPEPFPFPSLRPACWGTVELSAVRSRGVFSLENGIGRYPAACTLSEAALAGHALHVRARQPGDRIAPTGMKGSKKLQDLFVDEKVPEHLRDTVPLVVCDGEVAWVPGYRVARRFAVPAPDAPSVKITVTRRSEGVPPAP